MNTAEQRAKLTRLRDQVADLKDSVHSLYAAADAGSRLEAALESAYGQLASAKANLGRARDALGGVSVAAGADPSEHWPVDHAQGE